MALVLLGLSEFGVSAVEPVQHAENPETLVEPGTMREMVTYILGNIKQVSKSNIQMQKKFQK